MSLVEWSLRFGLILALAALATAIARLANSIFALARSRRFNGETYGRLSAQLAEIAGFARQVGLLSEPTCLDRGGHAWGLEKFDHNGAVEGMRTTVIRGCAHCPIEMVRVVTDDGKPRPAYYRQAEHWRPAGAGW